MVTICVSLVFAILYFGVLWHDDSSGSAAKSTSKNHSHENDSQNQ